MNGKCHPDREVTFTPAEFNDFPQRDISRSTCVVFDVLRATTTMLTAINHGAAAVLPVETIEKAMLLRKADPEILLAGERDGIRISAKLSGGVDFNFGNSPREFESSLVAGKRIAMTTTNGTRALNACLPAERIIPAALINRRAVAEFLARLQPDRVLLVCSGTVEDAAMEDVIGAGALASLLDQLLPARPGQKIGDGWRMARALFESVETDLTAALSQTRNGRRLAGMPELCGDLPVCAAIDSLPMVATMNRQGEVRRVEV